MSHTSDHISYTMHMHHHNIHFNNCINR